MAFALRCFMLVRPDCANVLKNALFTVVKCRIKCCGKHFILHVITAFQFQAGLYFVLARYSNVCTIMKWGLEVPLILSLLLQFPFSLRSLLPICFLSFRWIQPVLEAKRFPTFAKSELVMFCSQKVEGRTYRALSSSCLFSVGEGGLNAQSAPAYFAA